MFRVLVVNYDNLPIIQRRGFSGPKTTQCEVDLPGYGSSQQSPFVLSPRQEQEVGSQRAGILSSKKLEKLFQLDTTINSHFVFDHSLKFLWFWFVYFQQASRR